MARIYVIDDDEQLLRMVGLMLQRGGHTTNLIGNPVDGFDQIMADKPDLLVLDVMMPNMSGHDLARKIRDTPEIEDLPILILTARSQEIDRATALESGADGYLSKPVTSQELIEKVDDLLTQKSGTPKTEQGIIIALYSLRGGVGQTTLAVNLASSLRRFSQKEVCLVDLSLSGSQASFHLRLQPRTSWADLLAGSTFEWAEIQKRLIIHPSGLRILAAPALPQLPTVLSGEATTAILETLRQNVAFVVVDLPPVLSSAFVAALQASDMAMHVITPDVIAVQTALNVNRAIAKANVAMKYKTHVVNQTTTEAPIAPTAIEKALSARIAFQIGYDANQPRALTQGVPLTLTNAQTVLPTAVNRMAEVIWQRVGKQE
ncbi:MAG: response regulator [Ardenticatenaceae bacterium]|nr:response regulator [Anaerolineales bacterium]MCB8923328.1 response regulator [Ardenticatenaceae bacterium]MCB9004672.1 response regulator [Ardenticatenaceae bacterium]